MKTLFEYQSESGAKSGRKDVPEGSQGLISPPPTSGTPQDNPNNAPTPSKSTPVASKDIKTINHTTQPQTTSKNGKSRTTQTDHEWRTEYFMTTREHPRDLIKRARERDDARTVILVDNILNGYHRDNRKRNKRTEDDLITDGNWYNLCLLAKAMREGKK